MNNLCRQMPCKDASLAMGGVAWHLIGLHDISNHNGLRQLASNLLVSLELEYFVLQTILIFMFLMHKRSSLPNDFNGVYVR